MTGDTTNLNRALGRWRRRKTAALLLDAALSIWLGFAAGGLLMIPAAAWLGHAGRLLVPAGATAAAAGVILVATRRLTWRQAFFVSAFAVSAEAAVLAVALLGRPAAWMGLSATRIQVGLGVFQLSLLAAIGAVLIVRAPQFRLTVHRWLDDELRSGLLLTTAADLSAAGSGALGPSPVEQAILRRAERLAADRPRLGQVRVNRLDRRWWGLLAVLLTAAGLLAWLGDQTPRRTGGHAAPVVLPGSAALQSAAGALGQLALVAAPDTPAGQAVRTAAAQAAQAAGEPERQPAALSATQAALAAQVAAARPVIESLGRLANEPAGAPLTAVMAEPGMPTEQAVAAAAGQVRDWQSAGMSAANRAELAAQLRQAARQVAAANPELSEHLSQAADALAAGNWQAVMDQLGAVVRQIQPIVRDHRLAEAALRAMDGALAATSPKPPAPPAAIPFANPEPGASGGPQANDPAWQHAADAARQELLKQSLTSEQQRLVRDYFGIGD